MGLGTSAAGRVSHGHHHAEPRAVAEAPGSDLQLLPSDILAGHHLRECDFLYVPFPPEVNITTEALRIGIQIGLHVKGAIPSESDGSAGAETSQERSKTACAAKMTHPRQQAQGPYIPEEKAACQAQQACLEGRMLLPNTQSRCGLWEDSARHPPPPTPDRLQLSGLPLLPTPLIASP